MKAEDRSREFLTRLDSENVEKAMLATLKIEGALKYGTLAVNQLPKIMHGEHEITPELREFLSGLGSQYVEASIMAIMEIEYALKNGTLTLKKVECIMQERGKTNA